MNMSPSSIDLTFGILRVDGPVEAVPFYRNQITMDNQKYISICKGWFRMRGPNLK